MQGKFSYVERVLNFTRQPKQVLFAFTCVYLLYTIGRVEGHIYSFWYSNFWLALKLLFAAVALWLGTRPGYIVSFGLSAHIFYEVGKHFLGYHRPVDGRFTWGFALRWWEHGFLSSPFYIVILPLSGLIVCYAVICLGRSLLGKPTAARPPLLDRIVVLVLPVLVIIGAFGYYWLTETEHTVYRARDERSGLMFIATSKYDEEHFGFMTHVIVKDQRGREISRNHAPVGPEYLSDLLMKNRAIITEIRADPSYKKLLIRVDSDIRPQIELPLVLEGVELNGK